MLLDHPRYYFDSSKIMEINEGVIALGALAQPARLKIFRFLVRQGSTGICAGDLSREFDLPKPTLSFHLKELTHAGLIEARREGRSIYYGPNQRGIQDLMSFLTEDCCQGQPELCLPKPCCEDACTEN